MITGMHHFSIIAASEESVSFYKHLGFNEFKRIERGHDTVVLLNGYNMWVEVFIDPRHPPRAIKPENRGLRNISLRVDNVERTVEELGLEVGDMLTDWIGERYCFVRDPDGLLVQLHE